MSAFRSCCFRELHDELPLVSRGGSNRDEDSGSLGKWITAENLEKHSKTVLDNLHQAANAQRFRGVHFSATEC